MPTVSIVIPVLNDEAALARLLHELGAFVRGGEVEIIVADGGSVDNGPNHAREFGCVLVNSPRSRGKQLAAGVARARANWIWLLHADSTGVVEPLRWMLGLGERVAWGRFPVRFEPASLALGIVALMMNLRSRVTCICTGDQGIFVHRRLLERCGGIPPQPLMEDVELSRRLKRAGRPLCPRQTLTTSSRRWRARGVVRTILSMWGFRIRYWLGADPEMLAQDYYR